MLAAHEPKALPIIGLPRAETRAASSPPMGTACGPSSRHRPAARSRLPRVSEAHRPLAAHPGSRRIPAAVRPPSCATQTGFRPQRAARSVRVPGSSSTRASKGSVDPRRHVQAGSRRTGLASLASRASRLVALQARRTLREARSRGRRRVRRQRRPARTATVAGFGDPTSSLRRLRLRWPRHHQIVVIARISALVKMLLPNDHQLSLDTVLDRCGFPAWVVRRGTSCSASVGPPRIC